MSMGRTIWVCIIVIVTLYALAVVAFVGHTPTGTVTATDATTRSQSVESAMYADHMRELGLHSARLTTCAVLIDDYHYYLTHAPVERSRIRICRDFLASEGVTENQREELVAEYRQRSSTVK